MHSSSIKEVKHQIALCLSERLCNQVSEPDRIGRLTHSHEKKKPAVTTTAIQRRELAQRTNHGIEVALFWSEPSDRLTTEITDTRLDERSTNREAVAT
jgi:hypothetical protein